MRTILILVVSLALGVSGCADPPQPAAVRITSSGRTGLDVGETFLVSGTTSSNLKGKTVGLQIRNASGWSTIATTLVSVSGTFRLTATATVAGRNQALRVEAVATPSTIAAHSAAVTVSVYPSPAARSYLFADEFASDSLDRSKWGTRHQPRQGYRRCAQPAEDMVSIRDGAARLTVQKRPGSTSKKCPHGVWDNAMIGTLEGSDKFRAGYGVIAARVRFQPSRGMHGAFWMQGPPVTGAEIDIAEYFGDKRAKGGLASYVHYVDGQGAGESSGGIQDIRRILPPGQTPSNSWHVYSVEWDPSGYVFRVDGYSTLVTSEPFVATSPETVILSLLTSDWELPKLKDPTSTMYVDWVRAWS